LPLPAFWNWAETASIAVDVRISSTIDSDLRARLGVQTMFLDKLDQPWSAQHLLADFRDALIDIHVLRPATSSGSKAIPQKGRRRAVRSAIEGSTMPAMRLGWSE
jgi:hypothetical protein